MDLSLPVNAIPINELNRLENLRDYKILDTKPGTTFNHLSSGLAVFYDVPISQINFVDQNRVWTISNQVGETITHPDRSMSLCTRAIESKDITVYEDTWQVKEIENNPFVKGTPPIRFYAAAPITTAEGYNIGVVCIVDFKPRSFSKEKLHQLAVIANMVKGMLEKRLEVWD